MSKYDNYEKALIDLIDERIEKHIEEAETVFVIEHGNSTTIEELLEQVKRNRDSDTLTD